MARFYSPPLSWPDALVVVAACVHVGSRGPEREPRPAHDVRVIFEPLAPDLDGDGQCAIEVSAPAFKSSAGFTLAVTLHLAAVFGPERAGALVGAL